jgi:hypothetical protein
MQPGDVLAKTEKGLQEIQHRGAALTAAARRVLILVDGQRSVADLVHELAHHADVAVLLDQLQVLGLVRPIGNPGAAVPAVPTENAADSQREALAQMAETLLGNARGAKVLAKLRSAPDAQPDLSAAVDACVRLIRLTIDERLADNFKSQAALILRRNA